MKGYDLSFCRDYGYPRLVEQYLKEVLELIDKSGVLSIVVLGSTARGELSYRYDGDRLDLLSDLEMVVVTEGRPRTREPFYRKIEAWQRERRALNPLFHVDVTFMPRGVFRRLTPLIRWFEMRATGQVVYGADTLDEAPEVTPENLNRGQTRELVLTRLWNMLLYIPAAFVFNTPGEYERLIFNYVQCRNFLDVATILLPLEGVLLPSYRQRLVYVESHFERSPWAEYFDTAFPALLREALIGKLDLRYERTSLDWYRRTVGAYRGLTAYLLGDPALLQDSDALCDRVRDEGLGFLQGRAHKWLAYELGVVFRHARQKTPGRWMRWLALRKREAMVCFLFHMHQALMNMLGGLSAGEHLKRAAAELAEFAVAEAPGGVHSSPQKQWLALREAFVSELGLMLRFDRRHRAYLNRVIRWEYGP